MKIRKLHLKNIGVFDDEEIEFKECEFNKGKEIKDRKAEIHILTGENGSGKTTILQGLVILFCMSLVESPNFENPEKKELLGAFELGKNKFSKRLREFLDAFISFKVEHQTKVRKYDFRVNLLGKTGRDWSPFEISKNNSIDVLLNEFSFFANGETKGVSSREWKQKGFGFAAFAYSGYRRIQDEPIEIGKENDENPLSQSLNFIKDENSKFTINQWLGRNLQKRSLANEENNTLEANRFAVNIKNLETAISEIIGNEISFKLKIDLSLVLIKDNEELDFDVLPDGLKSLISWIGDLLMRLDSLKWKDDTPIFDREIILFLDEIEVHLHPAWQRKVLPIVQKLFKNAQIFVSTHSPFVVNSVDDAWVYKLKVKDGKAKVESVTKSEDGNSYSYVLEETFDIKEEFGVGVEKELDEFYKLRESILSNGSSEKDIAKITKLAKEIAKQSEELNTIIQIEIRQINRRKGLNLKV